MQAFSLKNFNNLHGKSILLNNFVRCNHHHAKHDSNIYFLTKPNPDETVGFYLQKLSHVPHPFFIN